MAAKKSTKKSTKKTTAKKDNCPFMSLLLAALSLVVAAMVFLPGIVIGEDTVVGGLLATFGGEVTKTSTILGSEITTTLGETLFNVTAFLAFVLPLVFALVYLVIEKLDKKVGKVLVLLPTLAFIASAVLLFMGVKFFLDVNGEQTWISVLVLAESTFKLGLGYILGASVSVLGAVAGLYGCYVKLVK